MTSFGWFSGLKIKLPRRGIVLRDGGVPVPFNWLEYFGPTTVAVTVSEGQIHLVGDMGGMSGSGQVMKIFAGLFIFAGLLVGSFSLAAHKIDPRELLGLSAALFIGWAALSVFSVIHVRRYAKRLLQAYEKLLNNATKAAQTH